LAIRARQEPAFLGLLSAYYIAAIGGDWSRASPPRVRPGDTILVHAGVYKDFDRTNYSHEIQSKYTTCCGTPWDGTYFLTQSGTADRPIAIKGAGDGDVVFDGDGNNVLFNIMGASHLYFEGLTFRNTTTAIEAGQKGIAGAEGLTVKFSRFEDVGVGIHSDYSGSRNFYIADSVFVGRNEPDAVFGWLNQWPWCSARVRAEAQAEVVLRGLDLWLGPRDGIQPREPLPRRARSRAARAQRTRFNGTRRHEARWRTSPRPARCDASRRSRNTRRRPVRTRIARRSTSVCFAMQLRPTSAGRRSCTIRRWSIYGCARVRRRLTPASSCRESPMASRDGPDLGAYELGAPAVHYGLRERPHR
jgi:hypothetical protein